MIFLSGVNIPKEQEKDKFVLNIKLGCMILQVQSKQMGWVAGELCHSLCAYCPDSTSTLLPSSMHPSELYVSSCNRASKLLNYPQLLILFGFFHCLFVWKRLAWLSGNSLAASRAEKQSPTITGGVARSVSFRQQMARSGESFQAHGMPKLQQFSFCQAASRNTRCSWTFSCWPRLK